MSVLGTFANQTDIEAETETHMTNRDRKLQNGPRVSETETRLQQVLLWFVVSSSRVVTVGIACMYALCKVVVIQCSPQAVITKLWGKMGIGPRACFKEFARVFVIFLLLLNAAAMDSSGMADIPLRTD